MSGYHSPEEWRAVPGFEAIYEVSSWGRMRSTTRTIAQRSRRGGEYQRVQKGRMLSLRIDEDGYVVHSIAKTKNDLPSRRVHILVALAFLGPPPFPDAHVDHKDGEKTHNCDSNLRYLDPFTNNSRSHDHSPRVGARTPLEIVATRGAVCVILPSLREAAAFLGCHHSVARRALDRPTRSAKGYQLVTL